MSLSSITQMFIVKFPTISLWAINIAVIFDDFNLQYMAFCLNQPQHLQLNRFGLLL